MKRKQWEQVRPLFLLLNINLECIIIYNSQHTATRKRRKKLAVSIFASFTREESGRRSVATHFLLITNANEAERAAHPTMSPWGILKSSPSFLVGPGLFIHLWPRRIVAGKFLCLFYLSWCLGFNEEFPFHAPFGSRKWKYMRFLRCLWANHKMRRIMIKTLKKKKYTQFWFLIFLLYIGVLKSDLF